MSNSSSLFRLSPDLVAYLNWSAGTSAFVQEWQSRLQAAEKATARAGEHVTEAASMVLSTVEQLSEHTIQVLTDLYRLSGQLPAPQDKLLVGPLELQVAERVIAVGRSGSDEQVIVTYTLNIVRYRYEAAQLILSPAADFSVTA